MSIKFIKNRSGDIVDFDTNRIYNAIYKAYLSTKTEDVSDIPELVEKICQFLEFEQKDLQDEEFLDVENIQNTVEKVLMQSDKFEIAKEYIIYRNRHSKLREEKHIKELEKLKQNSLMVIKQNWNKELFSMDKIRNTYNIIVWELSKLCPFEDFEKEIQKYIVDNIKTSEINHLLVKTAVNLISVKNINWQEIAWRFATIDLYKRASKSIWIEISEVYSPNVFLQLVKDYVHKDLYYKDFLEVYDSEDFLKAGSYIKPDRDMEYWYTTILMFKKRYLLNLNGVVRELPQHMYMAIAMFLAIPEKKENRLNIAFEIYDAISTQKLSLATPTLMNARRKFHQLSSCFVLNSDDDLRSIYHNIENIAQISKFGWWVGTYLWHIRSKWWSIRWVKWVSGGIVPWIKVINDTAIAVNQLWARAGAVSVTTDIWHRDIDDFLDLQTETGDIRRKCFDIFPAVSIPNIFMDRVVDGSKRTLFDPKEIEDVTWKRLEDYFWEEFEDFYKECEKNSDLILKKEISAKELFKKFLKVVVETWMPYVFFRDTANELNPNKHVWNVYSSQLCTEIIQNTKPAKFKKEEYDNGDISLKYEAGEVVVCNLASINVAKVYSEEEMKKIIPLSMRVLDNVIDLNFFPIKEAEKTAQNYRSVGLGFLWLAEYLATKQMMYDSQLARDHVNKLFERYAFYTIKSSNDLAKERWYYPFFPGSEWSKWIIMWKSKEWFKMNSSYSQDWLSLIDSVKEYGLRFSYHLSPAPNTSTANVVWTTAWLLPIYKKYFVYTDAVAPSVNVAPKLSQENFWFYKEYVNMKMPEVIDMISTIQQWIDQAISFEWIINPANTSPKDLYEYYIKAWKQKIKTVYYVRSMTLDVKECVSCSG